MNKKKLLYTGINLLLIAALYGLLMLLMQTRVLNPYYMNIIKLIFINILLAVSLNLVTGFLGQLVLGHAGFMSVGAYTAALFTMNCTGLPLTVSFPLALMLGGLMAALFGVIIGIPALRLRGDYLAIITLGFGEIIRVLMLAFEFTGGARGLSGIPRLTPIYAFTMVFVVVVLSVALIYTFLHSRHGRAVMSIRENEIAAEASGVRATYYKLFAFVMAAFFAGVAGGLYAHHVGVISPAKFDFNYSVEILVMVVLGGMGSITGSVVAAVLLTLLPELLRDFSEYRMILYALILIIMMLFKPSGLLGRYEFSLKRLVQKITGRGPVSLNEQKGR